MTERTLCIIKPDGVENRNVGKIIDHIEAAGFTILGMKRTKLNRATVEAFYAVHKERPFYGELCDYMTRGPVVLIGLEAENAVVKWRELIGATDPAEASEGTIRKLYGKDKSENTVHGSDSPENGRIEVGMYFSESELIEQR